MRLLKVLGKIRKIPLQPLSTSPSSGGPSLGASPTQSIQKTGGFFQQLPEIYPSDVYFKKALKKTREIKIDGTIKNIRNANRKHAAQVMDGLMKALTVPITKVLGIYKKDVRSLHPYEVIILFLDVVVCINLAASWVTKHTVMDLTIVARVKAGHRHLKVCYNFIMALYSVPCFLIGWVFFFNSQQLTLCLHPSGYPGGSARAAGGHLPCRQGSRGPGQGRRLCNGGQGLHGGGREGAAGLVQHLGECCSVQ